MTPENQALLDAIRSMLGEVIAPLDARLTQVEARLAQLEQTVGSLDARLARLEVRLTQVEARLARLEERVELIDARTNQMASDLIDLRDRVTLLEERVDNGLRALKSDLNFAFSDTRKASTAQRNYEKTIEALKQELAGVQQRLAALERSRGAS